MMKSLLRKRIDTVADATDEENRRLKIKLIEATKAKATIDQATTNNDVEQAKSSGVTTIEGIQPDTIKKSSKQAIDDSANAKSELTIIVMQLKKRRRSKSKSRCRSLKLKRD